MLCICGHVLCEEIGYKQVSELGLLLVGFEFFNQCCTLIIIYSFYNVSQCSSLYNKFQGVHDHLVMFESLEVYDMKVPMLILHRHL